MQNDMQNVAQLSYTINAAIPTSHLQMHAANALPKQRE